MEIVLKLNEEELRTLEETKNREGFFIKDISAVQNNEEFMIGLVSVNSYNFIGQDMKVVSDYFQITFKLGENPNYKEIKTIATQTYFVAKEEIDHTLFGEHMLVNTIDGTRIKLKITK